MVWTFGFGAFEVCLVHAGEEYLNCGGWDLELWGLDCCR